MSRSRKRESHVRVVGERRKEPDVRRIAKAIIRLSLDSADAADQLGELEHTEKVITRRRKTQPEVPDEAAS